MDYQPPTTQPSMDPQPTVQPPILPSREQTPSNTVWYLVGALVVIAALAIWYYYSTQPQAAGTQSPIVEQAQTETPPLGSGNTTTDISADLNLISDDSAALDQEAIASDQAVQSL